MQRLTIGFCALAAASQPGWAQEQAAPTQVPVAEQHQTSVLAPNPHRIWVLDSAFPAAQASRAWILDGQTGRIEGSFNMGYWPNMGFSPDGREVYSLDSFWEKHTRGDRHDYLTTRDSASLNITNEVELPKGRFLVVPKKHSYDMTTDGRYGLSFNLAPATTVSVVDLKEKKYLGELPIPGCGLIFAAGPSSFADVCSDGTMQTVSITNDGGTLSSSITRTEAPVFDAEADPVFEHAGVDRANGMIYFVTYGGTIIPVNVQGKAPAAAESWSLLDDAARAEEWRPGGWQMVDYNPKNGRLYVLMHKGPEWTHKNAAEEIWVVDVAAKAVEKRLKLEEDASIVAVSREENPLIFTANEKAEVITYDSEGKEVAKQTGVGFSPQLIYVEGEYAGAGQ